MGKAYDSFTQREEKNGEGLAAASPEPSRWCVNGRGKKLGKACGSFN